MTQPDKSSPNRNEASRTPAANILYAILALQNGLLPRDCLLEAVEIWMRDKNKSLVDVLVSQKLLGTDERQLMDALFVRYLARFDGDVEASLAGLSSLGSVRAQLADVSDPDVEASLSLLGAAKVDEVDSLATLASPVVVPLRGITTRTHLRILRPHAKGGLGQVSVALDEELHREVAFKELQQQAADNSDSRGRFVREAEITGRLEHPGIVPVYGMGQYADGRPFYAMRFIKGQNLHEALQRFHTECAPGPSKSDYHSLKFRELLGRFVDVCDAISYAHSRDVLHRDLKPGNIMLGEFGETLVVDWGLAKVTTDDAATLQDTATATLGGSQNHTRMGTVVGTPQYMSPEQASGQLDALGPATDIYSLGSTLYCLLTGTAPIPRTSLGEMIETVKLGTWPPPRRVHPHIPRPLESICIKAMALRPDDRYKTAQQVGQDVRHWLADKRVTAHNESIFERMGRVERRHRTLVRLGILAGVFMALAAFVTWNATKQQRKADRFASALDEFVTTDLALALRSTTNTGLIGGAFSEASARFANAFSDRPEGQVRLHVSFGNALLRLGDLDNAERQFELARALLPQAKVPDAMAWQAQNGAAVVRWRRGNPDAMKIVQQIESKLPTSPDVALHRWFELERANALKNSSRKMPLAARLRAIDEAAAAYDQFLPQAGEAPNETSLNRAEMFVERGQVWQDQLRQLRASPLQIDSWLLANVCGAMKTANLEKALEEMQDLIDRSDTAQFKDRVLLAEIWSEYAKTLHRLARYVDADEAYATACERLKSTLGQRHWRTIETTYSWMYLLNTDILKASPSNLVDRLDRGRLFFVNNFFQPNLDPETILNQNGVAVVGQLARHSNQSPVAKQCVDWVLLDKTIRQSILSSR